MCWSPTADLIAGGGVCALGVVCLAGVRRRADLPLAMLPLVLGMHQLVESAVWRGADGELSADPAQLARTVWAAIAFVVLPALVPVGVWLAAPAAARARLAVFPVVGLLVAVVLAANIASGPVSAQAHGHVLGYGLSGRPALPGWTMPLLVLGYLAATLGSLVCAGDPLLRRFGVVVSLGAAGCIAMWKLEFASTWCAFAAIVSVLLIWWVRRAPASRTVAIDAPYPTISG